MITKDKIEQNKKSFTAAAGSYKVCTQDLIDSLADIDLFKAPASTRLDLHNAFEGGLVDHLLRVTSYAIKINDLLPASIKAQKESVVRVSMLHGLGKVGLYEENKSEWHRKNLGKMYEFKNDMVSMSVGERSIYYITTLKGATLTEKEFQAIANFDKPSEDKMAEWHTEPLGEILKMAIKLAILEEKATI